MYHFPQCFAILNHRFLAVWLHRHSYCMQAWYSSKTEIWYKVKFCFCRTDKGLEQNNFPTAQVLYLENGLPVLTICGVTTDVPKENGSETQVDKEGQHSSLSSWSCRQNITKKLSYTYRKGDQWSILFYAAWAGSDWFFRMVDKRSDQLYAKVLYENWVNNYLLLVVLK